MTDITTPQTPDDSRKFFNGLGEDGLFTSRQVPFNYLDFGAVFGGKTTSTTENTVSVGLKTFTLDVDDGKIAVSYCVQCTSLFDPDCFMYGIVTRKDTTSEPAEIDVAVSIVSALTNTNSNWEIQVVAGPMRGPETNRIGISATTNSIASGTQTFTTQSGKFFPLRASVIMTSLTDNTAQMIGKITAYSGTTLTVFVSTGGVYGSGSHSAWFLEVIDIAPVTGGVNPTTVVKQAEATSNGNTITAPADIKAGDLLVLADLASYFSVAAPPSGFTQIHKSTSNGAQVLSCKLADGSEASATLTGVLASLSTPTLQSKILQVFRPDEPAVSLTIGKPTPQYTTGNPTAQVIGASAGTHPLVVIGAYGLRDVPGASGSISPRSMTAAKDGETNTSEASGSDVVDLWLAYKIYNSAPADVTIDMDDEGVDNILQGCYIELVGVGYAVGDIPALVDVGGGTAGLPAVDGSRLTNITTKAFKTISVSGQSDVVADTATDTLTLVGGNLDITTSASTDTITIFMHEASEAEMEAATVTNHYVSPGRQHSHPAHPKCMVFWTWSMAAVTGNISAVDTATERITWSANHGLASGDCIVSSGGTWPTGYTALTPAFVNVVSSTVFTLHLTYAAAIAGTSAINLTAAGSGTRTMNKITVVIRTPSFGVAAAAPQVVPDGGNTLERFIVYTAGTLSSAAAGTWITNNASTTSHNVVTAVSTTQSPAFGTGSDWTTASPGTITSAFLYGDMA